MIRRRSIPERTDMGAEAVRVRTAGPAAAKRNRKEDFYRMTVPERLRAGGLCFLAGAAAQWLCYESLLAFPAGAAVALLLYRIWKQSARDRRKLEFEKQFSEFLSTLYSGLMAGYSMENGVRSAAGDMERMYGKENLIVRELRGIVKEMSLHVPAARLFISLGERSGSEDIRNLGEVLSIAEKAGGSPDQTLKVCYRTILERMDTRQEIAAVIAGKVFEQRIMSVVPAGIILYLRVSFGNFMDCLYGNAAGACIMTAALTVYMAAVVLGERMVRVGL